MERETENDQCASLDQPLLSGMECALPVFAKDDCCNDCGVKFVPLLCRRHHCRNCGESFCANHASSFTSILRLNLLAPQRTCDGCIAALTRAATRGWESVTTELPATVQIAGIHGLELRCQCLEAAVKQLKVQLIFSCCVSI